MGLPLRISLVQQALIWENIPANLDQFERLLEPLQGHTDLIVLPEMFTTGFSMQPEKLAETMDGSAIQWMTRQAARTEAVVTGSLIIREHDRFFNRLVWMRPDGSFDSYDKRHLSSLAGEHHHYHPGQQRLITTWKGWRVCPLVCYDLRFPVWSRNNHAYDLLIYVANFPAQRAHAWKQLLLARAIENQTYVAGLNRTGIDGKGHAYAGDSAIIDFEGNYAARLYEPPAVLTTTLHLTDQQQFQQKFRFLADQDDFAIQ